ncbi:osmoprotectant transport system substrate-binding protein [Modestobacter sp. DSM 44400]|uniref:glycine betaine ABC transporter substrate-binding protein n=1 Tax=Modestobacter sp. DSM 44400 TaxID=1550230 RepID=UPI000894B987|nr:glycine betaine ABC transporter substrate-binding protein [Modestobacter sp. DSM 44400]SDY72593.1 osmoprotectant transport system substrate-binding protein [Modestobacter sp. DSM 44400]
MRHKLTSVTGLIAGIALLSSCALGEEPSTEVSAGSLAAKGDLSDVEVTVGGKEFTEQLILCELTAQALESAGATANRSCGMSGSSSVRSALLSGDLDMYWEYTGTGWVTHLGETEPIADPQELYQAVAKRDKQENSVAWLEPAPANNTYAVAVSREKAEELGVETLSDYAELVNSDPASASFCGAAEFFGRDDGWPGLKDAYGFDLPGDRVSELAAGPIYNAIDTANPCVFGEVFATDGRIAALDLAVLEDDKQYFTAYNPAVSIRAEVLDQHPAIEDVLAPVAEALDDQTLQSLNAKVDVDGETPEEAAKEWLVEKGFVGE